MLKRLADLGLVLASTGEVGAAAGDVGSLVVEERPVELAAGQAYSCNHRQFWHLNMGDG